MEIFEISRFLADLVSWASRAVAFYKGKGSFYEDFYKEKWPRATRKFFISPFMKGKAVIKTFIKGNGRVQRGNFLYGFL